VEYYFSDLNLATTDHLMRFINKDPEGFGKIIIFSLPFPCLAELLGPQTFHSTPPGLLITYCTPFLSEGG